MRRPLFVCSITKDGRKKLEAGLRSKDAFVLRRCQILFASARDERVRAIARVRPLVEKYGRND
jgi:hypothetical protein